MVSRTARGRAFLAGEVKWSGKPFADTEIERLSGSLLSRPLPPDMPPHTRRILFVPKTASGLAVTTSGVMVIDADAVMQALG